MIEDPRAEYEVPSELPNLSTVEPAVGATSPSDFSPDTWSLPLSLRIVAFGFTLFGVLSAVEILIQFFIRGGMYINLGVLAIFIGSGLRKWRASSRGWAAFWTWATLIFLVIWLPFAIFVVLGGHLVEGLKIEGATTSGLFFASGLLGYLVWQLCVLRRPDIVRRFETASLLRVAPHLNKRCQSRGLQFSLGSLLMAMVMATFVMFRLTTADIMFELSDIAVATKGGICHYGVQESRFRLQPERLAYVVFVDNESNVSVSQTGGSNGQRTYLTVWNHLEIELPGEHQLYEIINGKLQTRDERVSLVELGDYLTSEKDRPSLAALVNHAKALRAKK